MKLLYEIFFLVLVSTIFFLIDIFIYSRDCLDRYPNERTKVYSILWIHHLVAIFIIFGWLSTSRVVLYTYILLLIVVFLHWNLNNGRCIITQIVNRMCGYDEMAQFNDFFQLIGVKKYKIWDDYLVYVYIIIAVMISIYKLYRI